MPHASNPADIASAVAACRDDSTAMESLRSVYAQADAELAENAPPCEACGRCCRFAEAGHRLLVTGLELAVLTETPAAASRAQEGLCPYQQAKLCAARGSRPLGCRVFFCACDDEDNSQRYERHHRQIRRVHAERGLPYVYAELTGALSQLLTCREDGQNREFPVDTAGR